ncbi:MAG: outer membrane protein assembly factor BamB family protein, partial [Thermoguttaceae bacterium]
MTRNQRQILALLSVILAFPCQGTGQTSEAPSSFSTGGHTIYHLGSAALSGGQRGIVAAAYDGAVLCYTPQGKQLWIARFGNDFPYDLCVADIDGDPQDEALVATAGGELLAIDDDGSLLWSFNRTAPLFQVAAARQADGTPIILTGGVDQELYALSSQGELRGSLKTEHCIRHIRTGDFRGDGRDGVAVATASTGLNGKLTLMVVDPTNLDVRWKQEHRGAQVPNSGRRFFSMLIVDVDKDRHDDILLSSGWGENGRIVAYDGQGKQVFTENDRRIPNIPYRMNLLRHVTLPDDEFVLGHFGNVLIVYELDGSCREVLTGPYSLADSTYDPVLRTCFLGSSVSGGDGIYALRLDRPNWRETFKSLQAVGTLAEIEKNVATLERQIAAFHPPAYQPPPRPVTVLSSKPPEGEYRSLRFVGNYRWSQQYGNRDELWCRDIDRRCRYDMTADDIVAAAAKQEAKEQPFTLWAGHGHAVFFPLSTFQRIIEAAPTTLWGFEFAEMEGVDSAMQEVMVQIILPVAELCRQHGKKIIFRNKNIYWNGTCYVPFLKEVLLTGRYRDVFVPGLEETNCRTQELSLAGRIGLWQAGMFDAWLCRVVTDNANWDRMWEYAGQQVPTHHLRDLVSQAALGADFFFNDVHQGPFSDAVSKKLTPFYDMLEKGIVHIPGREELLSLSDVAIGMQSPPASDYIQHGINGHNYEYPAPPHPAMVFDRLDCYWGGAPLADHDASRYVYGLERRQCNFLAPGAFGMVAIVPADTPIGPGSHFRQILKTDGQSWYDDRGERRDAAAYKSTVLAALQSAAERLPVRVEGRVHWSVVRLDPTHVRITLVDPGYLDP